MEETLLRAKESTDIFERARLIDKLRISGVQAREIAKYLGLEASYISHYLRLLRLPELIQDGYYAKVISGTHLFIISRLKTPDEMINLYEQVLQEGLSTQDTEVLVREKRFHIKSQGKPLSAQDAKRLQAALKRLSPMFSARLIQSRIQSKIEISLKASLKDSSPLLEQIITLFARTDWKQEP